jgi:hypothetical protein
MHRATPATRQGETNDTLGNIKRAVEPIANKTTRDEKFLFDHG